MHQKMHIQTGLDRRGVVAARALEGFHTAVDAGVTSEMASLGEALSAFTTLEGLLTRVHMFVLLSVR